MCWQLEGDKGDWSASKGESMEKEKRVEGLCPGPLLKLAGFDWCQLADSSPWKEGEELSEGEAAEAPG